jgi:hypothetical protein
MAAGLIDRLPGQAGLSRAASAADAQFAFAATLLRAAARTGPTIAAAADSAVNGLAGDAAGAWQAFQHAQGEITQPVTDAGKALKQLGDNVGQMTDGLLKDFNGWLGGLNDRLQQSIAAVTDPSQVPGKLAGLIGDQITDLGTKFKAVTDAAPAAVQQLMQLSPKLLQAVDLSQLPGALHTAEIGGLIDQFASAPEQLRAQLGQALGQAQGQLESLTSQLAAPLAAAFPSGLAQQAGDTLRLVRAFGDAPNVDGMAFNRDQIGYFFNPLKAALPGVPIDLTPVNALVNRGGDFLKATGIRLPTAQLLDQVLPPVDDVMKQFDLGKLLPDFAGLKLDKLLPDLKAPDKLADAVKITHQFDRQAGRGWVQADVHIEEEGPTTLFDAGPVRVTLSTLSLTATLRIAAGLDGAPQRTQSGRLTANWDLILGGTPVITFANTALTFDQSGKTKFDLDPKNIRLNGVLQVLSDALAKAGSPAGGNGTASAARAAPLSRSAGAADAADEPVRGFVLRLKEDHGNPVGVEAILELPLPNCEFGPCGLSNLSFGASFELVAVSEFALGVRAHVARKVAPFTLVIFILGGGGWFDVQARYFPLSGRITTALSIGLSAGAQLGIDFGVIKGSIYAFFYVEAELQTDSAAPGTQLTIRIGLLLGGDVDVLGLVSVSIKLLLELEYQGDGGTLIGRGSLSLTIKICWCITIPVHAAVEKRFGHVGGMAPMAFLLDDTPDAIAAAVKRYLSLLE